MGKDTGCRFLIKIFLVVLFHATSTDALRAEDIHVRPGGIKPGAAIRLAKPGDSVIIHPGDYDGGEWIIGVRGTSQKVITIRAADPKSPPVISGGLAGWQLSACSHLVIEDIVFQHQSDNGLNIDDNDQYQKGNLNAATDIRLNRIVVRDLNADDNNDGIKLSGLRNFTLSDCRISNWGKMGCAVDMLSCSDGKIVGIIADGRNKGGWGIQAKGGSQGLLIQECQVSNVTQRGIQVGGGTSPGSFRDNGVDWEAKSITVQSCDVYGGDASIAIIHATDVSIRNCRCIHPRKWFFRFLNENTSPRFQASRNVSIEQNLCVAHGEHFIGPVNSGVELKAQTVGFQDNFWFHESFPKWDLRLGLPSREQRGISGIKPPGSFLRKDVLFTESRFEQLGLLLGDEIPRKDKINRFKWIVTLGLLLLQWCGLWVFCLVSTLDTKRQPCRNTKRCLIGKWLLLLGSLVFASFHIDLHFFAGGTSYQMVTVNGDRFELLLRSIQLGCSIFLLTAVFDWSMIWKSDSLISSMLVGCIAGMLINGTEYFLLYQVGRHALDLNHLLIDATVGLFSGVLAHGFTRDLVAFYFKVNKVMKSFPVYDGLLWSIVGLALFVSSIYYPSEFDAEFLYDRFRSYGANMANMSSLIDVSSLAESLLFCIPFAWATARIYLTMRWSIPHSIFFLILSVVLVQSANIFRIGRYFQLNQTALAIILSLITWIISYRAHRKVLLLPRSYDPYKILVKLRWLLVVVPWILMFWICQYL